MLLLAEEALVLEEAKLTRLFELGLVHARRDKRHEEGEAARYHADREYLRTEMHVDDSRRELIVVKDPMPAISAVNTS